MLKLGLDFIYPPVEIWFILPTVGVGNWIAAHFRWWSLFYSLLVLKTRAIPTVGVEKKKDKGWVTC